MDFGDLVTKNMKDCEGDTSNTDDKTRGFFVLFFKSRVLED